MYLQDAGIKVSVFAPTIECLFRNSSISQVGRDTAFHTFFVCMLSSNSEQRERCTALR